MNGDSVRWLPIGDLKRPEISRWHEIVDGRPEFRSPFLQFEYAREVGLSCPGVRVGVIGSGETPAGFWPLQEESRSRIAIPVGGPLNGLQGLLADPGLAVQPCRLLSEAGLSGWKFSHQLPEQAEFAPYAFESLESPLIDVSQGFAPYLEERLSRGHTNRNITNTQRKKRRLARDAGDVSVETRCLDPGILDTLISWKRVQLQETARRDPFHRFPWVNGFLVRCLELEDPRFRAEMFVLRANQAPIAMLYGFRSFENYHGVFLGFDRRYASFSPGIILLVELAKAAQELGIDFINLGKGDEFYKKTLESRSLLVSTGLVTNSKISRFAGYSRHLAKTRISRSAIGNHVRRLTGRLQRSADAIRH